MRGPAAGSLRLFLPALTASLALSHFAGKTTCLAAAQEGIPAAPEKYVTDRAGVLRSDRVDALSSKLERFERETSNQILVWIDRKIPERFALEDFTVRAAEKWGAGQAEKDNGAVLFVFIEDRKVRIEVGYGLEGTLPDVTAKRIIDEQIVPRFRQRDYASGVEAAVDAMMAATKGEYRGSGSTVAGKSRRGGSSFGWLLPLLLFFGIFFFILPRALRRGWRTYSGRGWWTGGGWGGLGGGSGWGGFGGGGGFSGGGGSFGGGGASGSW